MIPLQVKTRIISKLAIINVRAFIQLFNDREAELITLHSKYEETSL
jgi:hypothetical protein